MSDSRVASLDLVKGLAALWVVLIHAEALPGNPAMTYLFNRAAPIFVVLMGVNAELWWRRRDGAVGARAATAEWYRGRFRRLYVPMWLAVAAWWAIAAFAPADRHPPLRPMLLAEHLAGYVIGIGTGWFVTLAIAVALAFPLLHALRRRIGVRPLLAIGIVSTCLCFTYRFDLIHRLGMFGWFGFPPRLLAHVAFGMALAPFVATLGWRAAALAAAACAIYALVPIALGGAAPWQLLPESALAASSATTCANRLMDLPVTVLLLVACSGLARIAAVARPLAWLGNESYGIYLGQMVAHNALSMLVGFQRAREALGWGGYAAALYAGAIAWVLAGRAVARFAPSLVRARADARAARAAVAAIVAVGLGAAPAVGRAEPSVAASAAGGGEPSVAPASRPLVLLVGDSTTQGVCEGCPPPPASSPAGALEMLRARLPDGSRWRDLRAVSVGVGGTTSGDWVRVRPEVCAFVGGGEPSGADIGLRVLARACADGTGLARAARAIVGEPAELALVVLGANDVMNAVAPEAYVANLRAVAAELAPATVLVATPFWSPQPERAGLAGYAAAVREARLLSGPDFYAIHLPVDGSRVHLTQSGYAAAAALWLDKLPR